MRKVKLGDTVFVRVTKRIDAFAHKRYTDPRAEKFETVYVGGEVVSLEEDGDMFSMKLSDNNGFERDGNIYFFSFCDVLIYDVPSDERGIYKYKNGNGEELIKTENWFEVKQ